MPGDHTPDGVPVVKVKDLQHHALRRASLLHTTAEIDSQYARSRLSAGDLLLSIRGSVGIVARVPDELDGANITQDTARIRPNGIADRRFLEHALQSAAIQQQIRHYTVGQAVKGINIRDVRRLRFALPPSEEQLVIADTLDVADSSIRCVWRLIRHSRKLKRGLLQQLLTGERRFHEFRDLPWRDCRLRDVATECNEPGRGTLGRDRIMGVTKSRGIVPMEDRLIGSVDRYQVVRMGWFAYNPMRLNIGSIARWSDAEPVLVSPDYVVFRCLDHELDPGYLDQYRRAHQWQSFMGACGAGSVRVRIYFNDLGRHKMHLPPIEEQQRIAEVLSTLDDEIQLLTDLHEALKDQKKGLMQLLLTGKVRVSASMLQPQETT
jgi:type I restriction enzyme S subunit